MQAQSTFPGETTEEIALRKLTIVRVLLERANDQLEQLDRLLWTEEELDRRALQTTLYDAHRLTMIAEEELPVD